MSYATYLRERSGDCIKLAVEDARDEGGAAALIDLARDYSDWAALWEEKGPEQRPCERSSASSGDRASRVWGQVLGFARH